LQEALIAALDGRQVVEHGADLIRARGGRGHQSGTVCTGNARCTDRSGSVDLIAAIQRIARERRGEWRGWAQSVRAALDARSEPLFEVNRALFACCRSGRTRAADGRVRYPNADVRMSVPEPSPLCTARSRRKYREMAPTRNQRSTSSRASQSLTETVTLPSRPPPSGPGAPSARSWRAPFAMCSAGGRVDDPKAFLSPHPGLHGDRGGRPPNGRGGSAAVQADMGAITGAQAEYLCSRPRRR
jgi:hypothetical protein